MKETNPLRVVLRTPSKVLLVTRVSEIEAEDAAGRFVARVDGAPVLTALGPSDVVLRKRDGSELRAHVAWGTLVKIGHELRVIVDDAEVEEIRPPLRMAG